MKGVGAGAEQQQQGQQKQQGERPEAPLGTLEVS
jgi:hypothetical protein